MYLTAILDSPYWIMRFSLQIRNRRPQKPLNKSFQTDLSTYTLWRMKNWKLITWIFFSSIFNPIFYNHMCKIRYRNRPSLSVSLKLQFGRSQASLSNFFQELEKKILRRVEVLVAGGYKSTVILTRNDILRSRQVFGWPVYWPDLPSKG